MKTKHILLLYFILFSKIIFAQIPTIKAIGGDGKNINWAIEKMTDEETGYFYNDCAQGVAAIKVSSTLPPEGKINYGISNLTDDDPMTAWIPAKPKNGLREWFEIKSPLVNTIYNGYQSSPKNWKDNSRVKMFKVFKNNVPLCYLELTDEMGAQIFELPGDYQYDKPVIFKFEIISVYKGDRWTDVAISHIDNVGCCFSGNTNLVYNGALIPISGITKGKTLTTININSGVSNNTEVLKTTTQKHLSLLKVTTNSKEIELTPEHPLYFKDYGFTSLSRILHLKGFKKYTDLINQVEILVWDNKKGAMLYEKLKAIELKQGLFETYAILKLKEGDTYIANGFITKTY
ncbi:MAG TPA: hypothetical protein VLZ83_15540 [Edaphocola sp.]|nr:hypothetical protein [Edaphocola sp.]